ncbi:hypothetical protein JCM19233_7293 [Vibrio astriarenae]|nr:hypothetical protein JCM19233_7293 [Vibrio sp. C7]
MRNKMINIALAGSVAIALSGCQTTTQYQVPSSEQAYLNYYQTPSQIRSALVKLEQPSFRVEYTEDNPLKEAFICGVTKFDANKIDGPLVVTYHSHGSYQIDGTLPPAFGQCAVNKEALLQVRADAVRALEPHLAALDQEHKPDLYEQYGIPNREEQERLLVETSERRERERLEEEAYASSPKGQMDRYALASAELEICAENLLITSSQARNGKRNLVANLKQSLESDYDQVYFDEQYRQRYNSVSNMVALNGYTTEMHQACRVSASSANQK